MIDWIRRRPWIWVVVAFVLLITAWTVLIKIARENQPESVPVIGVGTGANHDGGN